MYQPSWLTERYELSVFTLKECDRVYGTSSFAKLKSLSVQRPARLLQALRNNFGSPALAHYEAALAENFPEVRWKPPRRQTATRFYRNTVNNFDNVQCHLDRTLECSGDVAAFLARHPQVSLAAFTDGSALGDAPADSNQTGSAATLYGYFFGRGWRRICTHARAGMPHDDNQAMEQGGIGDAADLLRVYARLFPLGRESPFTGGPPEAAIFTDSRTSVQIADAPQPRYEDPHRMLPALNRLAAVRKVHMTHVRAHMGIPENEQVGAYAAWAAKAQVTPEDLERRRKHVPSLNAAQVRVSMKRSVWAAAAAAIRGRRASEGRQETAGRPGEKRQFPAPKQLFGGRRGGTARHDELPRAEGNRGKGPSRHCAHYLAVTRNLRAKRKLAELKGLTAHESRLLLQLKLGDSVVFREFTERHEPHCNPHCRYCRARGAHVPDTLLHFLTECSFWAQERDALCIETGLRREDLSLLLVLLLAF